MKRFDCAVIGDVILDVFFQRRLQISHFRRGTSYCNLAKIDFGGAGNVASGLSVLGENVLFVGKAGKDLWGRIYEANLTANHVTTEMFFEDHASTGLALVTAEKNGERSFYVFRGANDMLLTKEINLSAKLLKRSEYLYFSGYSLVSNPQKAAIVQAVNISKRYNVKVVFDPGAHNLIESDFELFKELLDICDIFCPNLEEARAITKSNRLEIVIKRLRRKGRLTALKCGKDGCILINKKETVKVPGFKAKCIDSTGAGDAFASALIFGLANNFPLKNVGQLANWFASQVTTRIGARNFPSKTEVQSYLKELKNTEK